MMEIHDASELMRRVANSRDGARTGQIFPAGRSSNSLVAVDLLEIEPGKSTQATARPEEQIVYVLSGSGELAVGTSGGNITRLQADSVLRVDHDETVSFRNTGRDTLRLLIVVPLVVWSPRARNVAPSQNAPSNEAVAPRPAEVSTPPVAEIKPRMIAEPAAPAQAAPVADQGATTLPAARTPEPEADAPMPDISRLVRKASELPVTPRPERRRPAPEPEPEPAEQDAGAMQDEEEEEAPSNLMELLAVFDGGSRGNPGQGYGSFLVQSPNRKPVIKRLEFGDNYTNNQAEYDSLIGCLNYIIERLEITNRDPSMVQLELKTDSDLVANQILGTFKVKDAGLRKRHAQALELLERFALWSISWQPREETVKLLGH